MPLLSHHRFKSRPRRSARRPRLELLERRELLASYTTPEDTALIVSDPNLATLHIVKAPEHGTVVPTSVGGFAYTPAKDYHGPDRFTYVLATTTTPSNTIPNPPPGVVNEASITVTPVNDPPVAHNDEFVAYRNRTLEVAAPGVLKNDKDVDNNVLKSVVVTMPMHGTLVLNENGGFKYTPADGYSGQDSFTYRASDGVAPSNDAKVFINVKPLPDARDDQYSAVQNTIFTVLPRGVLINDVSATNLGLIASLEPGDENAPKHGKVELKPDGSFTYTPADNYVGPDSFVYRATDATPTLDPTNGVGSTSPLPPAFDLARVHIYVRANPIVRANPDEFTTLINTPLVVGPPGVLRNDYVLYVEPVPGTAAGSTTTAANIPLTATLLTNPPPAGLSFKSDGSFLYEPPADFQGSVTFTYQAKLATTASGGVAAGPVNTSDPNTQQSDIATVTIHVRPLPLPAANDDFYRVLEGTSLTIAAPGVLGNDRGVEGRKLIAKLNSGPVSGELTLNEDGSFKYVPKTGFSGPVHFTYFALDANGSAPPPPPGQPTNSTDPILPPRPINLGTVTIHVSQPEPLPGLVAHNDSYVTAANTQLAIRAPGVLANDYYLPLLPEPATTSDLASTNPAVYRPLIATLVTEPAHGKIVLNANGSFEYEPGLDFTGIDTFTYQASLSPLASSDSLLSESPQPLSNIATVTIRVAPSLAANDTYTTLQNKPLDVPSPGVLGNDTGGSDEHPLTAVLISGPVHGKLELKPDGNFVYTPDPNFTGSDLFVYRAKTDLGSDIPISAISTVSGDPAIAGERPIPESGGNVAVVKIYVRAAQSTVNAYPDRYTTPTNVPLEIAAPGVLGNDYALVNHKVTASLAEGPTSGTVVVNADGSFTYTPVENFEGEVKFTYKATDETAVPSNSAGSVNVSFATVVIYVHGALAPPKFIPGDNQRATDESGQQRIPDWATLLSLSGDGQHSFVVSTDKPQLFAAPPRIDAAGQLTYTPAKNVSGQALVTVTLADGVAAGESASANFTIQIDKPHWYFNAERPEDVTADRKIAPGDVLAIVNYLNAYGSGPITPAEGEDTSTATYYDVNHDNIIAPIDALLVINYLNSNPNTDFSNTAEGEAAVDLSLLALVAEQADGAASKRKRL